MKPFNLKEYIANPSRKVVTRDGRKVTRILCTDAKGDYPIIALVEDNDKTIEIPFTYTKEGSYYTSTEHPSDLFFDSISKKHEG